MRRVPRIKDAVGGLGRAQLDAIAATLEQRDPARGLVVLCHYPCVVPLGIHEHPSHQLADGAKLRALLEQHTHHGARIIYIHGHIHHPWFAQPDTDAASSEQSVPFTCINAGAPCMVSPEFPQGQGFGELVLPVDPKDALVLHRHVLD